MKFELVAGILVGIAVVASLLAYHFLSTPKLSPPSQLTGTDVNTVVNAPSPEINMPATIGEANSSTGDDLNTVLSADVNDVAIDLPQTI
ncbi:MAG: hypothetical protein GXN93_04050 [Candidatus Diapherotrites archaeon]|nr:hypothetical protein [Candidatus Diapherotrites archaeon]